MNLSFMCGPIHLSSMNCLGEWKRSESGRTVVWVQSQNLGSTCKNRTYEVVGGWDPSKPILFATPAILQFPVFIVHYFMTSIISWHHGHEEFDFKTIFNHNRTLYRQSTLSNLNDSALKFRRKYYGHIADLHKFSISWKLSWKFKPDINCRNATK